MRTAPVLPDQETIPEESDRARGSRPPHSRRRLRGVLAPLAEAVLALGCILAMCLAAASQAAVSRVSTADVAASPAPPPATDGSGSCIDNALGQRFCAPDPSGSAVLDTLGEPVCAPGACVRIDGEWHCARRPGGAARITREQTPECEGGCAAPEPTYCEEL